MATYDSDLDYYFDTQDRWDAQAAEAHRLMAEDDDPEAPELDDMPDPEDDPEPEPEPTTPERVVAVPTGVQAARPPHRELYELRGERRGLLGVMELATAVAIYRNLVVRLDK